MLTHYKANVAPIYRTQLEQHLFATASPQRRSNGDNNERAWREWLRDRWIQRARRWGSKDSGAESKNKEGDRGQSVA